MVDSSVVSPAGFNHVCIISSNQIFSSFFSFLFPSDFFKLQVLAHKRSVSEFRRMVIIVDNVNILLFLVELGAIFLRRRVCCGIKLSNLTAGMKVMASSGYPTSDINSHLSPEHSSQRQGRYGNNSNTNVLNSCFYLLLTVDIAVRLMQLFHHL